MGAPFLVCCCLALSWCLCASEVLHRWENCFADGVRSPEVCCGEDAQQCFNNVFLKAECCRRGFAMMFAASPVEPLPTTGFSSLGRLGNSHPAYSARQVAWEREMAGSSFRYEMHFDSPRKSSATLVPALTHRKERVAFRYFKVTRFDFPAMAEAIRLGEYGLQTLPLGPGDVVLDIGANAGLVAVPLARLHRGVRIIAVEPDPTNFRYLLWNARANNVSSRIWALNAAICGARDPEEADGHGRNITYTVPIVVPKGDDFFDMEGLELSGVPCVSLEDIFALFELDRVALMKVDCEGCEFSLFSGRVQSLLRRVQRIVGELHSHRGMKGVTEAQVRSAREVLCRPGHLATGCDDPEPPIAIPL